MMESCCRDRKAYSQNVVDLHEEQHSKHTHTHQLLQYGAAQLIFQGPGIWSGSKVRQYPPCKVANPHIHLRVLQEAENVLQNVLLHQISLQLLHLSNVVLQFRETNYSSDCKNII